MLEPHTLSADDTASVVSLERNGFATMRFGNNDVVLSSGVYLTREQAQYIVGELRTLEERSDSMNVMLGRESASDLRIHFTRLYDTKSVAHYGGNNITINFEGLNTTYEGKDGKDHRFSLKHIISHEISHKLDPNANLIERIGLGTSEAKALNKTNDILSELNGNAGAIRTTESADYMKYVGTMTNAKFEVYGTERRIETEAELFDVSHGESLKEVKVTKKEALGCTNVVRKELGLSERTDAPDVRKGSAVAKFKDKLVKLGRKNLTKEGQSKESVDVLTDGLTDNKGDGREL